MTPLVQGTRGRARLYLNVREGRTGLQETELIAAARGGDHAAYATLVERYQEVAFRAAYLVTGDAGEAEDAAQDAFVKAYYALGRFRPDAAFRPWLLAIVTNEARNRRKAAARRGSLAVRAAADARGASESPEESALRREQQRALLDAISGLREEERLAVTYRYFLDLNEAEMAQALGCARGTVKSRLARALARLRQPLAAWRHAE